MNVALADTIPPLKSCRCGLSFDASSWAALPFVGSMRAADDDDDLELRNCPCGSTIAIARTRCE